jgi:putative ABC transport system ATP-binding protein
MVAPLTPFAVRCAGVTKVYGRGDGAVKALRGVDLEIAHGELFMLIGPSGCGKTTLISVIAAILDATAGDVVVLDEDLRRLRGRARTRFRGRSVGFVFQQFNLLPALTAAENVAIPLMLNGMGRAAAVRRGKAMLDRVGLGQRAHSLPSQLSGGQQQRVAIARALVHEPKLIVCDEPTSALDHETGTRVMELMREVAVGPDRTLIIVTHDARIFGFADRIARMDDGHIEQIVDSPDELTRNGAPAARH